MASPNAQERSYRNQFNRNRFAAIRGNSLERDLPIDSANNNDSFTEDSEQESANNARFFSEDSEDGILANYRPQEKPSEQETESTEPEYFAQNQQRARIAQGGGTRGFLSEAASLPDPEYTPEDADDDDVVTFEESLAAFEDEAREAETIDEARAIGNAWRGKAQQALDAEAQRAAEMAKEYTSRLLAKTVGNGTNAVDSAGWDGWISFILSYIYIMARGAVSTLVPENSAPPDLSSFVSGAKYTANKALHLIIPPYRPLREPGDFGYFLFMFIASTIIAVMIIGVFVTFIAVTNPQYLPGTSGAETASTSTP